MPSSTRTANKPDVCFLLAYPQSSHDLHNSGLSLLSHQSLHFTLRRSFFFIVFFLLLSVILSSKMGIGSLAITWLERERTADGETKTVKQFSFISSQVQILVLPDYFSASESRHYCSCFSFLAQILCRIQQANSVLSINRRLDSYLIPQDLGLSWEEQCLGLSKGRVRLLISGSSNSDEGICRGLTPVGN